MSDYSSHDEKASRNSPGSSENHDNPPALTSEQAREVTVTLQQLIKKQKRSVWDGPVELFKQFVKLVVPVTYFLGFLLMTVIVTDPSKLP